MSGEGKERIWAAEDRMKAGQRWFDRWESHSWADLEKFIGSCIRDKGEMIELYAILNAGTNNGWPVPAAAGPELKQKLWVAFRLSFETDSLSAMAATVVPNEDVPFSWKVFTGDPLIANYHEGRFGVITGPPREGKTNLGCILLEHWVAAGNLAFTNIKLEAEPYVWTPTAKTLVRAAIAARRADRRWLFLLDEGGASGWTRQGWQDWRSKELTTFIKAPLGKLGGNLVMIEQDPKAVPNLIQEWATSRYHVPRKGWVSIDLRGPELAWRQDVRDFPKTSLPYETRDLAIFRVDADIDAMMQATADAPDQLAAMLDAIDHPKPHRKSRDPRPRDELGRIMPYSSKAIRSNINKGA